MHIQDFHLFHGAVLTKLFRKDRPISLCLVETNLIDSWSAYKIIDAVLYIKHNKKPSIRKKKDAFVWQFRFNEKHLNEIKNFQTDQKIKEVCFALVCGQSAINDSMYICFLKVDDMSKCIDLSSSKGQTIHVKRIDGHKLLVWGEVNTAKAPLKIASDAIEKWEVPGS